MKNNTLKTSDYSDTMKNKTLNQLLEELPSSLNLLKKYMTKPKEFFK